MSVVVDRYQAYIAGQSETMLFMRRKGQPVGMGPGIVCNHGHGATSLQYLQYHDKTFAPGYFAWMLAREGYRVMAIDDAGITTWGDQASTDRINDAITWLQDPAKGGAAAGKVGMMGWSMGGLAALNWLDRNPAKHGCSWLWCPATDVDFFHNGSYVAPYPMGTVTPGQYAAEIDAAYPAGYAGDNPRVTPENYRGVGPIRLVHAADDGTIPQGQSQFFVDQVADPAVTLKKLATGGHAALFGAVTDLEMVQHFRAGLGVPQG